MEVELIEPVLFLGIANPSDRFAERIVNVTGKDQSPLWWRNKLLYMMIEHFKNRDPVPIYRRFRERGRLAPEGLQYVSSWVDLDLERCFQLMETEHPECLEAWLAN